MSDLIAIAYPDEFRAAEVRATLARLQLEYLIDLEDAVVVTRDNGGKEAASTGQPYGRRRG